VNAMRYGEPVSEAYNRLTIDRMRWSEEKVGIIQASMMEEETFLSYMFPILRYHSRFDELGREDLEYFFRSKDNTFQGYQMHKNVVPLENLPAKRPLADYRFADICYEYLDKMTALCKENGIELVLIKAPSQYPYWYAEYDAQIQAYADENGLSYYDLTKCIGEIGLDFSTDTYDAGLHLNLSGATKLSDWFADILAEHHGCADHRNDPQIAPEYNKRLEQYDAAAAE